MPLELDETIGGSERVEDGIGGGSGGDWRPIGEHQPVFEASTSLADSMDCQDSGRPIKDYNNKYFWQRPPQCDFPKVDIGLDDVKGRLMALGFLNNDPKPQRIDLVTVNDNMNAFSVHMFDEANQRYEQSKEYKIDPDSPNAHVSSI